MPDTDDEVEGSPTPMSWRASAIIAIIALGVLASYGLALAGEPQSQWLWCDVLKQCA